MQPEEEIKIKINKKTWKIRIVKSTDLSPVSYGECDDVSCSDPEIWIKRSLKPKDMMDTIIHEVLHAIRPELCEEAVLETATTITDALWKLKYRKEKKDAN